MALVEAVGQAVSPASSHRQLVMLWPTVKVALSTGISDTQPVERQELLAALPQNSSTTRLCAHTGNAPARRVGGQSELC